MTEKQWNRKVFYKPELYHDHFQNFKSYGIPKAQLIIADVPYNLGKKSWSAMCGNPSCFASETHKTKSLAKERWNKRPIEEALQKRIKELEAENGRLREALEDIAEFADEQYSKRIPAPSCVEFMTISRYAEKALKGAGE